MQRQQSFDFTANVGHAVTDIQQLTNVLAQQGVVIDQNARTIMTANGAGTRMRATLSGMTAAGQNFVSRFREVRGVVRNVSTVITEMTHRNRDAAQALNRSIALAAQESRVRRQMAADERRVAKEQERNLKEGNRLLRDRAKAATEAAAGRLAGQTLGVSDPSGAFAGYNQTQITKVQGLMQTLERTMKRSGLSAVELSNIFKNFASGGAAILTGKAGEVDRAFRRMREGFIKVGQEGNQTGKELIITWENFLRILQFQGVHTLFRSMLDGAKAAATEYTKLQQAIALVQTITDDAATSTFTWEVGIRGVSDAFNIPLLEAAAAAYNTVSNQVAKSTDATRFLASAAKFGKVTNSELTASVNILTSVINAYGVSAGSADTIAAELFKTIDLGRVNTEQLNISLGNQLAVASQLGLEYQELFAALTVITNQGVGTDTALTNLGAVMTKLLKPSKAFQEFLESKGFSSGTAAANALKLTGVLKLLNEQLRQGGADDLAAEFQDIRAIRAVSSLAGDKQTALYLKNLELIRNSTDQFEKAYQNTVDNLGETWARTSNRIKNIQNVEMGQNMLRVFHTLEQGVLSVENKWEVMSDLFSTSVNVFRAVVSPINATTSAISRLTGIEGNAATTTKAMSYAIIAAGTAYLSTTRWVKSFALENANNVKVMWAAVTATNAQTGSLAAWNAMTKGSSGGGGLKGLGWAAAITGGIIVIDQLVTLYDQATNATDRFKASQLKLNDAIAEGLNEALTKTLQPFGIALDKITKIANIADSDINREFAANIKNSFGDMKSEFEGLLVEVKGFQEAMKVGFDPEERLKDMKKDLQDTIKVTETFQKNFGEIGLRKFFLDENDLNATIALANELEQIAEFFVDSDIDKFRDASDEALGIWKDINKTVQSTLKSNEEKRLRLKEDMLGSKFNLKDARGEIGNLQGKAAEAERANDFQKAEAYYESIGRLIDKIAEHERKNSNGKSLLADKLEFENKQKLFDLTIKEDTFSKELLNTQANLKTKISERLAEEKLITEEQQKQILKGKEIEDIKSGKAGTAKGVGSASTLLKDQATELQGLINSASEQFKKNADLYGGKSVEIYGNTIENMVAAASQNMRVLFSSENITNAKKLAGKGDIKGAQSALSDELQRLSQERAVFEGLKNQRSIEEQTQILKNFDEAQKLLLDSLESLKTQEKLTDKLNSLTNSPAFKELESQADAVSKNLQKLDEIKASIDATTKAILDTAKDPTGKGYADGGVVTGPSGHDAVRARLTAGEFVMPVGPAMQFRPLLESIRSGQYRPSVANSHVNNVGDIHVTIEGGQSNEQMARDLSRRIYRNFNRGNSRIG